jgi:hypothetical protein
MLLIKKGVSSHSIARMKNVEVNIAWRMTNKIREAMVKTYLWRNLHKLLNAMRRILADYQSGVRINLMRTVNGKRIQGILEPSIKFSYWAQFKERRMTNLNVQGLSSIYLKIFTLHNYTD